MPITILDYVKSVVGDKDFYTAEDCLANGVDILGGCQGCQATIAVYNAYPSTSGYWRCADCIGNDGYATVAGFTASAPTACPACGSQWECACPEKVRREHVLIFGAHEEEIACSEKCARQLRALVFFLRRHR